MNVDTKEYLSVEEFAEKLKIHPNTVRRAIKKGRIFAFRSGSGQKSPFRIPEDEISRLAIYDMKSILEKFTSNKSTKSDSI